MQKFNLSVSWDPETSCVAHRMLEVLSQVARSVHGIDPELTEAIRKYIEDENEYFLTLSSEDERSDSCVCCREINEEDASALVYGPDTA